MTTAVEHDDVATVTAATPELEVTRPKLARGFLRAWSGRRWRSSPRSSRSGT